MKRTILCLLLSAVTAAPAMAAKKSPAASKRTAVKASVKKKPTVVKKTVVKKQTVAKKNQTIAKKKQTVAKKKVVSARKHPRVPAKLAPHFDAAAKQYRLDPLLLASVAQQESRFRTRAVSPVGARGVMQLMPRTARALGVKDSFNARQNIFGGAKYLRQLLNQFNGNVNLTLAAYNAGPGAVRKYRGIPPYRETRNYVASIRRDYDRVRLR